MQPGVGLAIPSVCTYHCKMGTIGRFARLKQGVVSVIKSAYGDYKNAAADTWESAKLRPFRSSIYVGLALVGIQCNRKVPDERSFSSSIVDMSDKMVLLSDNVRNTTADNHVQKLASYCAKGQIRYQSLGICSIMYYSEYDKNVKTYESQCGYVQPEWSKFHKQIIDVGIYNRWWVLKYHTTDYDVDFTQLPKDLETRAEKVKDFCKNLFGYSYFGNPVVPVSEQRRAITAIKVETD